MKTVIVTDYLPKTRILIKEEDNEQERIRHFKNKQLNKKLRW